MTDPDTLAELLAEVRQLRAEVREAIVQRDVKPPKPRPARRAPPPVDVERAREIALAKLRRAGVLDS